MTVSMWEGTRCYMCREHSMSGRIEDMGRIHQLLQPGPQLEVTTGWESSRASLHIPVELRKQGLGQFRGVEAARWLSAQALHVRTLQYRALWRRRV